MESRHGTIVGGTNKGAGAQGIEGAEALALQTVSSGVESHDDELRHGGLDVERRRSD